MLDMGFIPDIEKICSHLPTIRQTLLFSATMAPEIKKLTEKFLSNPREVAVSPPASTAITVEQFQVNVSPRAKNSVLEKIIRQEKVSTAFIFCNRKRDVDSLSKWLQDKGHNARPLHGDMAQAARTKTLEEFKAGDIPLLVCSDVAARGIDVTAVSHVFNYDVPVGPDDYVHRIGRTGRAGETGRAWMLVTKYDDKQLDAVIKRIGKEIEIVDVSVKSEGTKNRPASKGGSDKQDNRPKSPKANKKTHAKPQKSNYSSDDDCADHVGFGDDIPAFFK